jgi:hypothetical protein
VIDELRSPDALDATRITRRRLLAGTAAVAALPLMGAAPKSTDLILPPAGTEQVLTSADNEGLIDVHLRDGQVTGVSSLDAPANEASPMGLARYDRAIASDRFSIR